MSATTFTTPARDARDTGTGRAAAVEAAYRRLRRFLALDAVVTGGNALAYLALPGPIGELLGVSRGVLTEVGAVLLLFAAAVAALAARRRPPAVGAALVVDVNLLWPVLSLVALLAWFSPTAPGLVWIPLQAATVGGFAALQYLALRAVRAAERG
ncbi:hypothetical protein [Kitasatospora camelliae]|uniref:Integral membrane protein n=1 Tax=Kitasatospora camelliae TaxID=3156397 RepID=A0AAU8K4A3_9ACTN